VRVPGRPPFQVPLTYLEGGPSRYLEWRPQRTPSQLGSGSEPHKVRAVRFPSYSCSCSVLSLSKTEPRKSTDFARFGSEAWFGISLEREGSQGAVEKSCRGVATGGGIWGSSVLTLLEAEGARCSVAWPQPATRTQPPQPQLNTRSGSMQEMPDLHQVWHAADARPGGLNTRSGSMQEMPPLHIFLQRQGHRAGDRAAEIQENAGLTQRHVIVRGCAKER